MPDTNPYPLDHIVVVSDGDIDYTDVFGPFTAHDAEIAAAAYPGNDDSQARAVRIRSHDEYAQRLEDELDPDEDDDAPAPDTGFEPDSPSRA